MKKLKGNEKLRAVYANAASALTVQFNELKAKTDKPQRCPIAPSTSELGTPQANGKKPP